MTNQAVSIGEVAKASGVKIPTIRYYEQIGLLAAPPRTDGNRRLYADRDVRRLAFIRHARELGFEQDAIRLLLTLQDDPGQSCAAADAVARSRLVEVEHRIASLTALKTELERMIRGCSRGKVKECRVIEILANHAECMHDHERPALTGIPKANAKRKPIKRSALSAGRRSRVSRAKSR